MRCTHLITRSYRQTAKPHKTRDQAAARRIFTARNEAHEQPAINLQIARAYSNPLPLCESSRFMIE